MTFRLLIKHLSLGTLASLRFCMNPLCLALFAAALACSGEDDPASDDKGPNDRTFDEQVEDGAALYGMHCAHCHGDMGQGTEDGPRVVGEGALPLDPPAERMVRDTQFATAADVFAFAQENMPADDPMSLSDQQLVDILAFALFANGVTLEEPLTLGNAADIIINPG